MEDKFFLGGSLLAGEIEVEEAARIDREEGEMEPIKFTAAVWKVSTLADGGIRLVLDLSESAREIMGELARCQQNGIALEIEANLIAGNEQE